MIRLRYVSSVLAAVVILTLAARAGAQPPIAKPQPPPPVAGTTTTQPKPAKSGAPAAAVPTPQTSPSRSATAANPVQSTSATRPAAQPPADLVAETAPTEAQLGVRIYPAARFIGSYDAGRGQRYYLFGTSQPFAEMVAYYKTELKDRGELVFEIPPTHMFDVGKFREETMAFPPSVTIKDYSVGGGYANPQPGATPAAFPTVIQIVPPPMAPAGPIR